MPTLSPLRPCESIIHLQRLFLLLIRGCIEVIANLHKFGPNKAIPILSLTLSFLPLFLPYFFLGFSVYAANEHILLFWWETVSRMCLYFSCVGKLRNGSE